MKWLRLGLAAVGVALGYYIRAFKLPVPAPVLGCSATGWARLPDLFRLS